jgi:hypothetical protein
MSEQRKSVRVAQDEKRSVTRRERLLLEVEAVITWAPLEQLVARQVREARKIVVDPVGGELPTWQPVD